MNKLELSYEDFSNSSNINELLLKHGLIIVRNANLSIDNFENIAEQLGKNLVTVQHVVNEKRTIQDLSNDGLFANGEVDWHHDWSYGRGNYHGAILYNVKNAELSSTWYCDMSDAPQSLKDMYRNETGEYFPPVRLHDMCFTEKQIKLLKKQKITRPFVINHHVTDEEILYCSWGTIQNNTVDLEPIKQWVIENAYEHKWETGDLLIWDNLKMIHKRNSFTGERMLWRTQFII